MPKLLTNKESTSWMEMHAATVHVRSSPPRPTVTLAHPLETQTPPLDDARAAEPAGMTVEVVQVASSHVEPN